MSLTKMKTRYSIIHGYMGIQNNQVILLKCHYTKIKYLVLQTVFYNTFIIAFTSPLVSCKRFRKKCNLLSLLT